MPSTTRLFFLDWLRILAFGLLVPYHVGMYYVSWVFHVKSPFASRALEPWMMLSSPWRMSLIFLIAGAASAVMLKGHTDLSMLRQRTRRLLLPLLCGMLLVIPPQTYFEVIEKYRYQGSFIEFLGLYYTHYRGFCEAGRCLDMPTWNHLWFLPYLWLYTTLLWLWLRVAPQAPARVAQAMSPVLWLILPWMTLYVIRLSLWARFPQSYDLVHDGFVHAQFIFIFALGALFVQRPAIWTLIGALRWLSLTLALLSWANLLLTWQSVPVALRHLFFVSEQWFAVLAITGFAQRHWNRDHPWRTLLTEAVFPVYIFHQTWIIVLTRLLLPLGWTPLVEGPLIIIATFALSWLSYLAVSKSGFLRLLFGLKPSAPKGSGVATT